MATIMRRKDGSGTWKYTAQIRLARIAPVSQTFADKNIAKQWAEQREKELIAERDKGTVRRDVGRLTIEDLHLEYLGDPATKALRTYKDTSRVIQEFAHDYSQLKAMDLSALHIREWRDKIAKKRKAGSVNRNLAVVRSMWNWAIAQRLVPADREWPKRMMLTAPQGRVRYLDDAELARLLESAERDTVMHSLLTVALSTGMRRGELLRMTWDDVDLQKQIVTIHTTKTDRPRSVYLAPAAVAALKGLRGGKVAALRGPVWLTREGKPLKFFTMDKRWERIRDRAEIKNFRFHDIRHSTASWLAQAGATLHQIGSVLGHTNPATTMRYSHLIAGASLPGHDAINAKLTRK